MICLIVARPECDIKDSSYVAINLFYVQWCRLVDNIHLYVFGERCDLCSACVTLGRKGV
jgi:hypothetical protein